MIPSGEVTPMLMTEGSGSNAILATGLSKRFGSVQAVSHVDLTVRPGESLGLLGPNGAGKSTTLKMLMGLLTPDSGNVSVFEHPAGSPQARLRVGSTPQSAGFPDQLTPRELLEYTAVRYGTPLAIEDLVSRFGLGDLIDRRVAGFSGGEIRRVALSLAFVGEPDLVILDEPTTGLDAQAQQEFHSFARDYVAQGGALVLTSHHWDEVEAVCNTIALIDHGETVLAGNLEEIRSRTSVNRVSFRLPVSVSPPGWLCAEQAGNHWHAESADSDALLRRMMAEDIPFEQLTIEQLRLKDLIVRIRREEIQR